MVCARWVCGHVGRQYLRCLAVVAFIAADSVAPTAGRFVGRLVCPEAVPCNIKHGQPEILQGLASHRSAASETSHLFQEYVGLFDAAGSTLAP